MKFKISPAELQPILKRSFLKAPGKMSLLTITAFEGKVYCESLNAGSSGPAEVSAPGQAVVPAKAFRQLIDTYKTVAVIEIEGSAAGLRINSFKMPLTSWSPATKVPAAFA